MSSNVPTGTWSRQTGRTASRRKRRRLVLEQLEDRRMLAAGTPQVDIFSTSPALFVANDGQWEDAAVHFVHQGDGGNVALTDTGPRFQLFRREPIATAAPKPAGAAEPFRDDTRGAAARTVTSMYSFAAAFVGARPVAPRGVEPAATRFNYLAPAPDQSYADVPSYAVVGYDGLYDGIDLRTWGRRSHLKYEFHVAPGADYRQIQVRYDGIESLSVDTDGALHIRVADGWDELIDDAPYIYQEVAGQRTEVAGQFQLLDARTYAFAITGSYDPTQTLVIDPDLDWATYLGGSGQDLAEDVTADAAGNVYVTGYTASADWAQPEASHPTFVNSGTAFVAKLDPTGSNLLYATYLGYPGTLSTHAYSIAVDAAGNTIVTGGTGVSGWATAGAYDPTFGGGYQDAFVAKLNASGSSLSYWTYLGGSGWDSATDLAVDAAGNTYVVGKTMSAGLATPGAYDTSYTTCTDSCSNAFIAKLDASGGSLAYLTYLGGGGMYGTSASGIEVNAAGVAYVTGVTHTHGLATPGAYRTIRDGGLSGYMGDLFVAKFNASGSQLAYLTYMGASTGGDIALDAAGQVYVTGDSQTLGLATPGAYDTAFNGSPNEGFLAKGLIPNRGTAST